MKVAHVSQTDGGAGAGRAAYRIHQSLLGLGVDSTLYVRDKRTGDDSVVAVAQGNVSRLREYVEAKYSQYITPQDAGYFSPARWGNFELAKDARIQAADIVALYWVNGAFIKPEALAHIKKPIVWRLSDTWPFTGGCHYTRGCERFTQQCGECPQLAHSHEHDLSRQIFRRKQKAWHDIHLTIAAPSEWIAGLARKSALFSHCRIEVIPTGVDVEHYKPLDKADSRAKFGITQDKTVLLFGALDTRDPRKGFAELRGALEILASKPGAENMLAVIFGTADSNVTLPIASQTLGKLTSDESLAAAYSAADMVIVPSLEDNLPNVALEAMACGTPVVGFEVCGMPDVVLHQKNGYLSKDVSAVGLAEGIAWLLTAPQAPLKEAARKHALSRFTIRAQAEHYLRLYKQLG